MSWIVLALIVGAVLFAISIYNRLVAGRNRFKNAFAQIDVQLTRRHDLIPNLVETAKGYMKHERETLEAVITARNTAVSGLKAASKDPSDPEAMKNLAQAEQGLSGALGRLFALSEAYPDLKANQNMMQLSEELTTTENKVAFARQAYNDAVMLYNTLRESFPNNFFAGWFNFQSAELLEIEDEVKREVPQVAF
jgi:LemA protein